MFEQNLKKGSKTN